MQQQRPHSHGWALLGAAGAPDARYQAAEQEVPERHVHVQVGVGWGGSRLGGPVAQVALLGS
jgi:hypothetical protein